VSVWGKAMGVSIGYVCILLYLQILVALCLAVSNMAACVARHCNLCCDSAAHPS
jgi:hypothetical protein